MYIIGLAVGIVIALLLIVIITVMVIGFVRKHRRKNSCEIPTFPNPVYGNNQSKPIYMTHLESIIISVTKLTVTIIIGIVFARCTSKW